MSRAMAPRPGQPGGPAPGGLSRRGRPIPLPLGKQGLPIFLSVAFVVTSALGHAAYASGPEPHPGGGRVPAPGERRYDLDPLLWLPFVVQGRATVRMTWHGDRWVAEDPRMDSPIILAETVLYWASIGMIFGSSAAALGGVLGFVSQELHRPAAPPRKPRRSPHPRPRWGR